MRNFTCVQDLGNLKQALAEAFEIKKDRYQFTGLGKNKTLLMIFFNSSLRTRLSTQKAAGNRTRRDHGWRQARTPPGGYSGDGLLLRRDRHTFIRPFRKQGR